MTKPIDVEETAQAIDAMALHMRDAADRLASLAARMREKSDLSYAGEVVSAVTGLLPNLRLDLMVTRPLRQTQTF